jgi:NADPH2:quinone reductase
MTLVIAQYGQGGPEVMRAEKRDIPLPGAGFVEIAQRAIGFNYFDILQRKGMISDDEPGRVMGIEGAGVVAALGPGVQGFALNDRVGYLRSQGAYAETRLIEAGVLFHLPPDISFDIAAALTVKGFMAWLCACRLFNVQRGQTVLVTTAAGGIGSLITRLATHRGARVIGVVGTDSKCGAARANGAADAAVGLGEAIGMVARLTGETGVDVVFDGIGADTAERLFAAGAVRPGGSAISFGASGGWPQADHESLAQRGFTFLAPQAMNYLNSPDDLRTAMAEVFTLYRNGAFGEVLPTRYPLQDVAKLHRDVDSRTATGLAILVP